MHKPPNLNLETTLIFVFNNVTCTLDTFTFIFFLLKFLACHEITLTLFFFIISPKNVPSSPVESICLISGNINISIDTDSFNP